MLVSIGLVLLGAALLLGAVVGGNYLYALVAGTPTGAKPEAHS